MNMLDEASFEHELWHNFGTYYLEIADKTWYYTAYGAYYPA